MPLTAEAEPASDRRRAAPGVPAVLEVPSAPAVSAMRAVPTAPAGQAVRAVLPGDDAAVRRLFRETMCLGRPLPFTVPGWDGYESLCLDWYLGPGRDDAGVLVTDGEITGYALVCTNADGYERWQRHQATLFSSRVLTRLLAGGVDADASRFLRLRLRDGWDMWRHGIVAPLPAHAHINLACSARASRAGRQLADHVDRRCRLAGLPGWYGEMNAIDGHRAAALGRLGGTVVHRAPNHTLSWLLAQPVSRLTVARWLPPATPGAPPTTRAAGVA